MRVQVNFYDEKLIINLPPNFKNFKKEISWKYSIDEADVSELIIQYINLEERRANITNEEEYKTAIEYFKSLPVKNGYWDIFLEVSEKSKLFQREMANSKLIPLQINEKE